jgi:hypothetical protein
MTKEQPKSKTPRKAAKKDKGGRPTKFRPEYIQQARKLALLGQTDAQMAGFFGIGEATLHRWKVEHEGFRESILAGKERADADIADSLYKSALGGNTVTEVREEPDSEGNIIRKRVVRELPADVRAQRYWLGNRHPRLWRDKVVVEDETPPEMLAETATRYEEIMAKARERQRELNIARGLMSNDEE